MIESLIWFFGWSGYFWTIGLVAAAIAAWHFLPVIGSHVALVLLMIAGGSLAAGEFFDSGERHNEAKWEKKLIAETARRDQVLEQAQTEAAKTRIELESEKVNNDKLQREIALASRTGDGHACLTPDSLRRLQEFRRR